MSQLEENVEVSGGKVTIGSRTAKKLEKNSSPLHPQLSVRALDPEPSTYRSSLSFVCCDIISCGIINHMIQPQFKNKSITTECKDFQTVLDPNAIEYSRKKRYLVQPENHCFFYKYTVILNLNFATRLKMGQEHVYPCVTSPFLLIALRPHVFNGGPVYRHQWCRDRCASYPCHGH